MTSQRATPEHLSWNPGSPGSTLRLLVLAAATLACAHALAEEETPATAGAQPTVTAPRRAAPRPSAGQVLDQRVRMLSRGLNLDARQELAVRRILESQQDQIRRAWADPAVPASDRVAVTRGILERTRERIRRLLNDEQRNKYPGARPPASRTPPVPDVDRWMRLTQRSGPGAGRAN